MREMKDSGISWIGEIPEEWDINRGKYIFKYIQKPVHEDDGVVTCFRDGEVTLRSNRREDGFTMSDKEIGYQGIDVGDLIVHGMDGFAGAIGISDSRGKASPVLNVLDTDQEKKYYMYYLRAAAWSGLFLSLSTGIRVRTCDTNWGKLRDVWYLLPAIKEQQAIVNFLDSKCAEIDALSADIQSEIDTLEAYKRSVITEAVTKGLDKNVPMKDSGIQWIGKIPYDWMIPKIGYVIESISDVDHFMPSDVDEGIPYIMIGDLKQCLSEVDLNLCKHISLDNYNKLSLKSKPVFDDVIMARYATIGTLCYVDCNMDVLVSYACVTIHPSEIISGKYLYYYMRSSSFFEDVSQFIKTNTQGNIGKEALTRTKITLPSKNEQNAIVDFLDRTCAVTDSIIAQKQEQLLLLADYKKSLIYEYVTGKKEVPAS